MSEPHALGPLLLSAPMHTPTLSVAPKGTSHEAADALVLVLPAPLDAALADVALADDVKASLREALAADAALASGSAGPAVVVAPAAPGGRVILASPGRLAHETEDARSLMDAVALAVSRASSAGARRPVVVVRAPGDERFSRAREVSALAALGVAWQPLELREARGAEWSPLLDEVSVEDLDEERLSFVRAVEEGRSLCRDLTSGDPERMTPLRFAEHCRAAFAGTGVRVDVEEDVSGFPLLDAVARASRVVPRHRPCVATLTLEPEGEVERTLFLAGKGVTYDTGGADLKTDGSMAGMSRDKGGAATAAGLVLALARLRPKGLKVVAQLGLVRNSVGEDAFVSDEILRARSGVRVRIGNTDAEGRLVLADLLAKAREEAEGAPEPLLLSIATLTGHAYRAFGPVTAALENAAARRASFLSRLQSAGELLGEPVEFTRPRREDYAFVAPKTPAEDVLSSNRLASVSTPRGHQGPFAFLDVAAGLKESGLPFAHLDISGAVVSPADWQSGRPTGAPLASLASLLAS